MKNSVPHTDVTRHAAQISYEVHFAIHLSNYIKCEFLQNITSKHKPRRPFLFYEYLRNRFWKQDYMFQYTNETAAAIWHVTTAHSVSGLCMCVELSPPDEWAVTGQSSTDRAPDTLNVPTLVPDCLRKNGRGEERQRRGDEWTRRTRLYHCSVTVIHTPRRAVRARGTGLRKLRGRQVTMAAVV